MTTKTGRRCFSTVSGEARARSMRRPEPYLAPLAVMLRMEPPSVTVAHHGQIGHFDKFRREPLVSYSQVFWGPSVAERPRPAARRLRPKRTRGLRLQTWSSSALVSSIRGAVDVGCWDRAAHPTLTHSSHTSSGHCGRRGTCGRRVRRGARRSCTWRAHLDHAASTTVDTRRTARRSASARRDHRS